MPKQCDSALGSSEPVNASPFPHLNEPSLFPHLNELVNAAASLSNERDAATSLHMTEPVHAATFSCPPYTSRIPPHHSSKPFTPSSSFQTFHTLLIRKLPLLLLLPAYERTYEADRYLSRTHLTHSAPIAATSPARAVCRTYGLRLPRCSRPRHILTANSAVATLPTLRPCRLRTVTRPCRQRTVIQPCRPRTVTRLQAWRRSLLRTSRSHESPLPHPATGCPEPLGGSTTTQFDRRRKS